MKTTLSVVKQVAKRLAPTTYKQLSNRKYSALQREKDRILAIYANQVNKFEVSQGPFTGLKYIPEAFKSALLPKLLGTYEMELSSILELIISTDPSHVINVGCAEGYYAVGLALRLPNSTIIAFDAEQKAQDLCSKNAELNGIGERVTVKGKVEAAELAHVVDKSGKGTLLLCDCEGAEDELFSELSIAAYRNCKLIIELHEHITSGISKRLEERFKKSHYTTRVSAVKRNGRESIFSETLPDKLQQLALDEERPPNMDWIICVPKQ